MNRYRPLLLSLLVAALALSGSAQGRDRLTVMLDFFVNPNHAPLFAAQVEGFFDARGLDVEIQVPADPSDPPRLAAAGRADLALTTALDLIVTRDRGLNLTAVGSLIQHPLGGLMALADAGIQDLSDFAGRRIGFALEPEEPVLWTAMLATAGLDSSDFELVNVGFNTVAALLAGQVDAVGAFRNFEPLQLGLMGRETVFFPFEEHGVPDHWQLVWAASPFTLAEKRDAIRRFLEALDAAIRFTLSHPNAALDALFARNPDLGASDQRELNVRSMLATLRLFQGAPCHNDPGRWDRLRTFLLEQGLIEGAEPASDLFQTDLLPEGC